MQSVLALQLNLGVSNDCVIVFYIHINVLLLQSVYIIHFKSIGYTSLIPSLFFDWDRFGTDGFRIESIYRACSVR